MNSVIFEQIAMGETWRSKHGVDHVYAFLGRVGGVDLFEAWRVQHPHFPDIKNFWEQVCNLPEGKHTIEFMGKTLNVDRRVTRSTKEDKRWEVKLRYGI